MIPAAQNDRLDAIDFRRAARQTAPRQVRLNIRQRPLIDQQSLVLKFTKAFFYLGLLFIIRLIVQQIGHALFDL